MSKDIQRHEGDNPGGVNSFRFIPSRGVESLPDSLNGSIHHPVKLKSGFRWFDGYGTEDTMEFSEESQDTEHGTSFKHSLSVSIPKDRSDVLEVLQGYRNEKFILDITYNNGERKLVGSVTEPLYMRTKLSTRKNFAGKQEHEVVFSGESTAKAPFYLV